MIIMNRKNSVSEIKQIELVKGSTIVSSLTWLQFMVFLKEKKRNIFLLVVSAIILALVLFLGLFNFNYRTRCPDG